MKKSFLLLVTVLFFGCSRNDQVNNCNFLLNVNVNAVINLNLPQFSQLQFTGNSVRLEGQGNGGIIIARTGIETLRAWDGADPNRALESCSILSVDGLIAASSCEDVNEYELLSGQNLGENPEPCTLLPYRIEFIGNNQYRITN